MLETAEQVRGYIARCKGTGAVFGADTETTGLKRWKDTVVGFSLSAGWGEAVYIPVAHDDESVNIPLGGYRDDLADLLQTCPSAWHGAHYDCAIIARFVGIPLYTIKVQECTMLMAQCLGERAGMGSETSSGLKPLSKKYLGVERPTLKELFPEGTTPAKRRFASLHPDIGGPYAAADADDVLGLVQALRPKMDHWQVTGIYRDMEMPLLIELLWMEDRGCLLDTGYAERSSAQLRQYAKAVEAKVIERLCERLGRGPTVTVQRTRKKEKVWLEEELSLSSNDHLAAVLFQPAPHGLGLHIIKMTDGGKPSVDEEVLGRLAVQEDWCAWLLAKREADKARSTYFDTFESYCLDEAEGKILHPNYKQFGAETGRTSSDDPNVQNLPKEQKIGAEKDGSLSVPGVDKVVVNARDMLVARPGFYLVDCDWSAIEYRIIGGYAQDPGLIETFRNGIDIHIATAALMFGKAPADVTKAERQEAKTMNYALNFGAGDERLAGMLGVPLAVAKAKKAQWEGAFPHVAAWKATVEEFAKVHKYVQTLFGRKRWLNFGGAGVSEKAARQAFFQALREAVNTPVQGTAADLLKLTLLRLGPWLRQYFPEVRTLLTTHDSITFEVPDSIAPDYFVSSVRPVVEWPEHGVAAGFPAITADFVWGHQGWGSLTEDDDDEPTAAATEEPPAEMAAPVVQHLDPSAAPQPLTLRLEVAEQVTAAQLQAFNEVVAQMPGANSLVLVVPNGEGSEFTVGNVSLTEADGTAFAHIWTDYRLLDPSMLVATAIAAVEAP